MDPNIPPTAVGTYLTLCGSWEGLPVQASHWRGGSVGHQELDSAHQIRSSELF